MTAARAAAPRATVATATTAAASVEALPGVGPGLAASLRKRFGGDAGFFDAARRLDVQAISSVEGISERRAVELVRHVRGDADAGRFLATPAARKVHDAVMERLLRFAATDVGRNRLRLLHPLPSPAAAAERAAHVMAQKERVADLDRRRVRDLLRRIRPLADPKPVCDTTCLVIAGDDETYDRLHGLGVGKWSMLGSPRDVQQAGDVDLVLLVDADGIDVDLPHALDVPAGGGLAAITPQALLAWARHNRPVLEACRNLGALLGRDSRAAALLDAVDGLTPVATPDDLHTAVARVKAELDARLEEAVADLSLSGAELLRAVSSGTLPADLRRAVDAVLREGRDLLRTATGVSFQPFLPKYPVEVDDDEVERVVQAAEAHSRTTAFQQQQAAARAIAREKEPLAAEVAQWLEFDADFALGCFAHHHDLHAARFGEGLSFASSVHLDLADVRDAQRIAYRLGGEAQIAVLTGANSGGKSTLLEHLCQLVLMARMGLPVNGEDVEVPWVDEVHLVTARRGMDAGAFETFLKGFLPVVRGDARRLVLADEVESVTELEAAGRILAFFADKLAETDSLGVIVTHMAEPLLANVRTARLRVDGIEATGLDPENRLVVDRCPKMGVRARSTPELIVQRLVRMANAGDRDLYGALLERLGNNA